MHKVYLVGGVILLSLAVGCIAAATAEVVQAKYALASWRFWAAVVFHFASGTAAAFVLAKGRRGPHEPAQEHRP